MPYEKKKVKRGVVSGKSINIRMPHDIRADLKEHKKETKENYTETILKALWTHLAKWKRGR